MGGRSDTAQAGPHCLLLASEDPLGSSEALVPSGSRPQGSLRSAWRCEEGVWRMSVWGWGRAVEEKRRRPLKAERERQYEVNK